MAQARLVPSTYYRNNSSYVSVTNADNMYTNTDSTNYASVQNTRNSTSNTYYCYLRGFNFGAIPSNAIVNSFTIKLKASESYMSTNSSYRPSLYNGTTSIASTTVTTSLSTTATTFTFPNGSLTWDTLKGYGSDFGIRIPLRRSSTSYSSYVYVYGAEILVDYTVPVYHNVTINNSTSATVTATDTNPLEGTDVTIKSDTISGLTITDNGTDVTSQFTQRTDTGSYYLETRGSYGFTLNNSGYYQSDNKGVDKSCSVARVHFSLPTSATITFQYINYAEATYDFGVFGNVDTALNTNYYAASSGGATISDSSYKKACNTSSDNTSSVQTLTYSNVASGDHYIDVKFSKDDGSAANNDTLQFKVSITLNGTAPTYYGYDITNITADHTIVVTSGGSTTKLYLKVNGTWTEFSKMYKKVNGSWAQVSDPSSELSTTANYVKAN